MDHQDRVALRRLCFIATCAALGAFLANEVTVQDPEARAITIAGLALALGVQYRIRPTKGNRS